MAIATSAAILGGVAVAGGLAKTISGASQASKAKKALESFRLQDLSTSPYEGLSVSTLGSDLAREESARAASSQIEALRSGGVRGVVGGVGQLQRENNRLNRTIGADLDQQRIQNERLLAQDRSRTRAMRERRDLSKLSGLGSQLEAGRQDMWSGIGDIAQAGSFMGNNLSGNSTPQVGSVNELTPQGIQTTDPLSLINAPLYTG